MIEPEIAKRYALGLFYAASKYQASDQVLTEQNSMISLLGQQPKLKDFFEAPQISRTEKKELLRKSFKEEFHPTLYHFLLLLLNKHRFGYIIPIAEEYEKLFKEHKGIMSATIITARPLGKELVGRLRNELERKTNKTIDMVLKVDPAIIGGIVIRLGHHIIDHSVTYYLSQLKEQMRQLRVY